MKWKRSKKAQQESKMKDGDSLNSEKRQSNSHNLNSTSSNLKPSASQEPVVTTPPVQIAVESTQNGTRKLQEGEALYRPYVV